MPPVAVGSDDAGYALKERVAARLRETGYPVTDFGCYSPEPVDYPDVAFDLASAVARGEFTRGILICGTGIGMAIAANKVPGVRAAQAHDPYSAERARKSNDAQILTLGARVIGAELALSLVDTWLHAEFGGGASARKVEKITSRERSLLAPRSGAGSS
ncbi:MAG: ribose 5-phosphate isomerase B [Acidobacteriota bacterium]